MGFNLWRKIDFRILSGIFLLNHSNFVSIPFLFRFPFCFLLYHLHKLFNILNIKPCKIIMTICYPEQSELQNLEKNTANIQRIIIKIEMEMECTRIVILPKWRILPFTMQCIQKSPVPPQKKKHLNFRMAFWYLLFRFKFQRWNVFMLFHIKMNYSNGKCLGCSVFNVPLPYQNYSFHFILYFLVQMISVCVFLLWICPFVDVVFVAVE